MFELKDLWVFDANLFVKALAFSDNGHLGVASANYCAYILDQNGNLVTKYCGGDWMNDASYCCDRFGFVNSDSYVYVYDLSTGIWKKIKVGENYNQAITMLKDGFLAGGGNLAYFDFNGYKRWVAFVSGIHNGPAVYKDYVYVPRYVWGPNGNNALTILRLSDGKGVRTITISDVVWDTQVCSHYLAVGAAHHVYLTDISDPVNPKSLWSFNKIATKCRGLDCAGAYNVAFSPDCKYLVSADVNDKKIHLFDVQTGRQLLEKEFDAGVRSAAWWEDRIAVGLDNGKVLMIRIEN